MAAKPVTIRIDGESVETTDATSVAAAILTHREGRFRRSVRSQARGPLCGMGVCFECRATIDGQPGQRTCMVLCQDGMEVKTDA